MESAASVIAVVSLALSSTQVILKAVSGIKNAPQTIRQMAASVLNLSNLLKQLEGYSDFGSELPTLINGCAEDLRKIEKKLDKASSKGTKRAEKWSKDVMIMLQGREWEKRSALIQQHCAVLSLQLNIIEGKRGTAHSASLERIETLSNTQLALSTSSSVALEQTTAALTQMRTIMPDIGAASQESNQNTIEALRGLGDEMQGLAGLSSEQSDTLNTILELLKQQFPARHQQPAAEAVPSEAINHVDDTEMNENTPETLNDDDNLQNALDRLRCLAEAKKRTVFSAEADTIISDIEMILLLSLNAERERSCDKNRKRPRPSSESDQDDDDLRYQHDIKRMKGQLMASHCVAVNDRVSRTRKFASGKYESNDTYSRRNSRNGVITVQTHRKLRTVLSIPQGSVKSSPDELLESLEASIALETNTPHATRIAVAFKQYIFYAGSFLQTPVLSVSVLLPDDSEAFQLIQAGDLQGLLKSLNLKTTRLTDRDLEGRCLLNYAMTFAQPDICKFLIDEGADVNSCEKINLGAFTHEYTETYHTPIDMRECNDCEDDPRNVARTNQCRRHCLDAGADPTISVGTEGSFLESLLCVGTEESLRVLLDLGGEFIHMDSEVDFQLFLHKHLKWGYWTLGSVELLLRRGAHPGIRDGEGWGSCLHFALMGSQCEDADGHRDTLSLLIKAGANVYATDTLGFSIADKVCNVETLRRDCFHPNKLQYKLQYNTELQLRRIWADALTACGYDAEDVIRSSLRAGTPLDHDIIIFGAAHILDETDGGDDINSEDDGSDDEDVISQDGDDEDVISQDGDDDIVQEEDKSISQDQNHELCPDDYGSHVNCESSSDTTESEFIDPGRQTKSVFHSHNEWSLLEEDANVWRS